MATDRTSALNTAATFSDRADIAPGIWKKKNSAIIVLVFLTVVNLIGCDSSLFTPKETATRCVESQNHGQKIGIRNKCDRMISYLTSYGEKLIIGPGETHMLLRATGDFTFAACFIPDLPKLEKMLKFRCD